MPIGFLVTCLWPFLDLCSEGDRAVDTDTPKIGSRWGYGCTFFYAFQVGTTDATPENIFFADSHLLPPLYSTQLLDGTRCDLLRTLARVLNKIIPQCSLRGHYPNIPPSPIGTARGVLVWWCHASKSVVTGSGGTNV